MSRLSNTQQADHDADRLTALTRLLAEVYDLESHGQPVPCVQPERGHWWISEDPELAEAASHACQTCPALAACRAYVADHPEPAGVWAGLNTPQRRISRRQDTRRTA